MYTAGPLVGDGFEFGVNLVKTQLTKSQSMVVCRLVEGWCASECSAEWRVEHTETTFVVVFGDECDSVLFKLVGDWEDLFDRAPLEKCLPDWRTIVEWGNEKVSLR